MSSSMVTEETNPSAKSSVRGWGGSGGEKVPSFTVPCLGKLQQHTMQTPQEGLLLLYNSQNLLSWFILQLSLHTGS